MPQPDNERRQLKEELARLQNTPTPTARKLAPGDPDRLNHPQVQRIINRQLERMRVEAEEILDLFTPEIRVDVQPSVIPAPEVRVEATVVPAPEVRVAVPDQSVALLALTDVLGQILDLMKAKAAMEAAEGPKKVSFQRDRNTGLIVSATVTED